MKTREAAIEHITVLWGMSRIWPGGFHIGPPKEFGSAVRARFGEFTLDAMVAYCRDWPIGVYHPPYAPCVIRVFTFHGATAQKFGFLRQLSGRHDPFDFEKVFAMLASDVTYATLMKQRQWRGTRRLIERENENSSEMKFLKAGESVRAFNLWPMLRHFESMVRDQVREDPKAFEPAVWMEDVRSRRIA